MSGQRTLLVSATSEATAAMLQNGPRRDFLELAARADASVVYQDAARVRGWLGKLVGPHMRQAWSAARDAGAGDTLFADGEHIGLPLQLFLALRGKRSVRTVMLGHLVSKPWKLALLSAATRAGTSGAIVLHSIEQERVVRRWAGAKWRVRLVPYQVDTAFWTPCEQRAPEPAEQPLILAVGSENRDYAPLVAAVAGLPVRLVIAAGSHWARTTAEAGATPANVEYTGRALPFAELRELYRRASVVAVPVHDVANQSGVTTILEAMSCARPVVVTASRGQRECVVGPLVRADGGFDNRATRDRGPAVFGGAAGSRTTTGLYVLPADSQAIRAAIEHLLAHPGLAAAMGRAARRSAVEHFDIAHYATNMAGIMAAAERTRPDTRELQRSLA